MTKRAAALLGGLSYRKQARSRFLSLGKARLRHKPDRLTWLT